MKLLDLDEERFEENLDGILVDISISHDGDYAIASALCARRGLHQEGEQNRDEDIRKSSEPKEER